MFCFCCIYDALGLTYMGLTACSSTCLKIWVFFCCFFGRESFLWLFALFVVVPLSLHIFHWLIVLFLRSYNFCCVVVKTFDKLSPSFIRYVFIRRCFFPNLRVLQCIVRFPNFFLSLGRHSEEKDWSCSSIPNLLLERGITITPFVVAKNTYKIP